MSIIATYIQLITSTKLQQKNITDQRTSLTQKTAVKNLTQKTAVQIV